METVILFAFNRPNQILQAILSVNKNFSNHRPYIKVYLDEAKKNSPHFTNNLITKENLIKSKDLGLINDLIIRDEPYGCAENVSQALSSEFKSHERLFCLEDDLELIYFNKNLPEAFFNFYENKDDISNITCFSPFIKNPLCRTYLSKRSSSLAWGTWKKYWKDFDIEYLRKLKPSKTFFKEISSNLGTDMPSSFIAFQKRKVDSWAIPWCVYNFLSSQKTVYPYKSFVKVNGHKVGATHTLGKKFKMTMADNNLTLNDFVTEINEDNNKFLKNYSIFERGKRKLFSLFV
mgnify:CR=1 FL=1|tara:strand:+ start:1581 stop:2450 length:870 start_codon:yes stop_codon:yes gene_type:complete